MAGQRVDGGGQVGRLPATPRTSLVGRDDHVVSVRAALAASRLVTLTGPGGSGKTRLAIAALSGAGEWASDGVWWVPLATLHAPELVVESLADALGTPRADRRDSGEAVLERLRSARALVVLDNCEHLVAGCADLVDELLDGCPDLRILVTSREPLGVPGEMVRPVPPLALPPPDGSATAEAIVDTAAVRLFVERAQAAVPDFRLTDAGAADVARLCRRLAGLPLAIELAAARLRVLSVEQIVDGLDDVFGLLVDGPRTAPERQRTLRATLDWGHDLLTPTEQAVFRRLAVFPGSFDLAAARAVASGSPVDPAVVLDVLARLVDRSLVTVHRPGDRVRYRLLGPIRDHGRERLAVAGEDGRAGRAHLAHYRALAEEAEPLMAGSGQVGWLDRLEREGTNLRAALRFARDSGQIVDGARLATALWRLCALRGHYREGREWLDWAAVALGDDATVLKAKALRGGGALASSECDYPAAVRRLEAALQIYRGLDDPPGLASALQLLGGVARDQGRYPRAEALFRESLTLCTGAGDRSGEARARSHLGLLGWLQRDWAGAVEQSEAALAAFREIADAEGIAWSLISLGATAQYTGDVARAAELLAESHELAVAARYPEGVAWSLHEQGLLALRVGDGRARALLLDSLGRHRRLGDRWRAASVLDDLAGAELAEGRAGPAAVLLGASARIRRDIGTVLAPCERDDHDRVDGRARELLGPDAFAAAWTRGRDRPLDDALAEVAVAVDGPPTRQSPGASGDPPAAGPPLRIRVLGEAGVYREGRPIGASDWGYGKPRELFFLLACSPGRTKAQIGLALWPELSETRLRNAFHTALRDLRRALGDPGWVVFTDGRYHLDRSREHWCDLEEFESALAQAGRVTPPADALIHLQRAIALYEGDLLPGLDRSDWVLEQRRALAGRFGAALSAVGRLLGASGRWDEAVGVHRRAVEREPLAEASTRALMQSLVHAGEPGQAARAYADLRDRLHRELGVAPSAQTRELLEQLSEPPR